MLSTTDLRQKYYENKSEPFHDGYCFAFKAAVRICNPHKIDDCTPKRSNSSSKGLRPDIIKTVKLSVDLLTLDVSPTPYFLLSFCVSLSPSNAVFNLVEACCDTLMRVILIIPLLNGT